MLDLKALRADPELVREAMRRRGDEHAERLVGQLLDADADRRRLIQEVEALKAERNAASKAIGDAKSRGDDALAQIAAMQTVSSRIKSLDGKLLAVRADIRQNLLQLPNIPDARVPPVRRGRVRRSRSGVPLAATRSRPIGI